MLSVLHVLSSLNLGGAERVTIELAKVQRQENLDAQILSLGSNEDFLVAAVNSRNIPLWVSESGNSRFSRYRQISKILGRFDVLHIHSPLALQFIAPVIPIFSGKTIVYTRHGLATLKTLKLKTMHQVLRPFITYATFVTESGRDVFVNHHPWNPSKLKVIHNGVFVPDTFTVADKYPVRFGSVGRMVALKGQRFLIEAASMLTKKMDENSGQSYVIKFYGSGPLEPALKEQAHTLPPDMVEFCGEEPDLDRIYENIDVLVVTSESEGLSMVIIEAMARGIPVIATNVGGNSTLVQHEETGELITYGNAEELTETMFRFLSDFELIKNYGEAARNLILSRFSLRDTHLAYLECYIKTSTNGQ